MATGRTCSSAKQAACLRARCGVHAGRGPGDPRSPPLSSTSMWKQHKQVPTQPSQTDTSDHLPACSCVECVGLQPTMLPRRPHTHRDAGSCSGAALPSCRASTVWEPDASRPGAHLMMTAPPGVGGLTMTMMIGGARVGRPRELRGVKFAVIVTRPSTPGLTVIVAVRRRRCRCSSARRRLLLLPSSASCVRTTLPDGSVNVKVTVPSARAWHKSEHCPRGAPRCMGACSSNPGQVRKSALPTCAHTLSHLCARRLSLLDSLQRRTMTLPRKDLPCLQRTREPTAQERTRACPNRAAGRVPAGRQGAHRGPGRRSPRRWP